MRNRSWCARIVVGAVLAGAALSGLVGAGSEAMAEEAADEAFEVRVVRTSNGIPHITATDYASMGYGVGMAFAEDNICTAADFYVTVNGERSKYFGPDATWRFGGNGAVYGNLDSDFFYRSLIESGQVEALLAQSPPNGPLPEVREGVRGYVAGYNAWLESVGGADGITDPRCSGAAWVRPITEFDAYLRFFQLASLASTGVAVAEIGGAQPPALGAGEAGASAPAAAEDAAVTAEQLAAVESLPNRLSKALGIGSNAYGFGGEATDNGRGMVLGNPHFPWHGGERLYQMHLTIPGQLDVSGAALYGVPLVLIGHTEGVAWSHTVSTAYRFTPFELTLVPGSPTTYLVDGVPTEMERTEVEVEVLEEDGTVGTRSRTLYSTVHGPMTTGLLGLPLFPWTPVRAFAMGDANHHLRYLNQFFTWNHAQSTQELFDLQKTYLGIPWVNTIAADSTGQAYYADISVVPNVSDEKAALCNTELGIVASAALGLPVLDGSRSSCGWDTDADAPAPGIFGPGNLPYLFRDDYVTNGNDSYWLSNPAEPLEGFARIIGDERTERTLRTRLGLVMVEDRLAGRDEYVDVHPNRFTQDILKDVVFNNRQYAGELVRDDVVALCESLGGFAPTSDVVPVATDGACGALAAWDGRDDLDSNGAILFRRFWTHVVSSALPVAVDLPTGQSVGPTWAVPFDAADAVHTPDALVTADPRVAIALGDAITDLQRAGIPLDAPLRGWQYEDRGDGEQIPVHGGPGGLGVFNAINVGWDGDPSDGESGYPDVQHGSSFVMAVQFVDPATNDGCPVLADAIVTYSQSEDLTSPWFKDQTRMYADKVWNPMHFCADEVASDVVVEVIDTLPATTPDTSDVVDPSDIGDDDSSPLPVTGGGFVVLALLSLVAGRAVRGPRGAQEHTSA